MGCAAKIFPLPMLLSFDRAPAVQNSAVAAPSAANASDAVDSAFASSFGDKPFSCGQ